MKKSALILFVAVILPLAACKNTKAGGCGDGCACGACAAPATTDQAIQDSTAAMKKATPIKQQ